MKGSREDGRKGRRERERERGEKEGEKGRGRKIFFFKNSFRMLIFMEDCIIFYFC